MAGGYGVVDNALWKHHAFKELDDDAKLMFMYLKTCEHGNMIGCFHLPLGYIMADLKWTETKCLETLSKLFAKGFSKYDKTLEIVLLPKHLVKHPLQNPKQVKGAMNIIEDLPTEFKYVDDLIEIFNSQERVTKPYAKGLQSVCNTETETETETITAPKEKNKRFVKPTVEEIQAYCDERNNGLTGQQVFDHYEANGWMRGKTKVKDWKACVRTWEQKQNQLNNSFEKNAI